MSLKTASLAQPAQKAPRQSSTATLRDMIIVALYYRKMVAMIIAAGFVLGILAFIVTPVRHTARMQLMLLAGSETASMLGLATGNASIDTGRAANSEAELLRSRELLAQVVEKLEPGHIDPDLGQRRLFGILAPRPENQRVNDAIDFMENGLKVTTPPDTNLLVVSFTHKDRETAITIVDTLVQLYMEKRADIYNTQKSPLLKQKAQSYRRQLDATEAEIKDEKSKNDILDLPHEIQLAADEMNNSTQRLRTLIEHRAGLAAEIKATQKRIVEVPPEVTDYVETTDRVDNNETDNKLTSLYVEREHLEQFYRPDDSHRVAVESQIKSLKEAEALPKHNFSVVRKVRNPSTDYLTSHLLQLQIEADAGIDTQGELEQEVERAKLRVRQLRDAEATLVALERSRALTDQLYRDFTQRAEAAASDETSSAQKNENVRIVSQAESSLKGESGRTNVALAVIVGSIIIALSSALIADWNRQVLLLPQEIESLLDMPVLATFAQYQRLTSPSVAPPIIFLAGQLMFHRTAGAEGQSVQIVSAGPKEYREDMAHAIAYELASGQGVKTLLLDLAGDGTGHWSKLGKMDGVSSKFGFDLAPTDVENLDVSHGAGSGQNWLRLSRENLVEMFSVLKSRYQMIVIDAPPMHQNSTCIRLATMADASMLVIRAEHTRRSVAEHLKEQLLGVGGSLYGVVMTGRRFYIPRMIYRWL